MLKEFKERQILGKTMAPKMEGVKPSKSEDIFPDKQPQIGMPKLAPETNSKLKPLEGLTMALKPMEKRVTGEDQRKKILGTVLNKVK